MTEPGGAMRRASTVVEVLVIVAIIAIPVGLLVPAMQIIREKAARKDSENNLRQIGLAIHNWHDNHRNRFPVLCDHGPGSPTGCGVRSTFMEILPQMGHADVYALYDNRSPVTYYNREKGVARNAIK